MASSGYPPNIKIINPAYSSTDETLTISTPINSGDTNGSSSYDLSQITLDNFGLDSSLVNLSVKDATARETAEFAEQLLTTTTLTGDDYTDSTATVVKRAYYNSSNTSLYLTGSLNVDSGTPTGSTYYIDRIRVTMYLNGDSEVHDIMYLRPHMSWYSCLHYTSSSSTNLIEASDTLTLSSYSNWNSLAKYYMMRIQVNGTACSVICPINTSANAYYWLANSVTTTSSYPYSHWFIRGHTSTSYVITFDYAGDFRINSSGTNYWFTWLTDECTCYIYDLYLIY